MEKKRRICDTAVFIAKFSKDFLGKICEKLDTVDVLNFSLLIPNSVVRRKILEVGLIHIRLNDTDIYADKMFAFLGEWKIWNRVLSINAERVRFCLPDEFGVVVFLDELPSLEILSLDHCGPLTNELDHDELELYNRRSKLPRTPTCRLKTLSIKYWDAEIPYYNTKLIACYCVSLNTLKIVTTYMQNRNSVMTHPFRPFINWCKHLKSVQMWYCDVKGDMIRYDIIGVTNPDIITLNLSELGSNEYSMLLGSYGSPDTYIPVYHNLQRAVVPGNPAVFSALQKYCRNLKHLTVQDDNEPRLVMTMTDLCDYTDLYSRLESLQLNILITYAMSKIWGRVICQCRQLKALTLENAETKYIWRAISQCVNLTTLHIRKGSNMTDKYFLEFITRCKLIEVLSLGPQRNITTDCMSQLAVDSSNLTELSFCNCPGVTGQVIYLITAKCFNLEKLSLKECGKRNDSVALLIAEMSNITELVLNYMKWVTDVTMKNVAKFCPLLIQINLKRTEITNNTLLELENGCPVLDVVNLEGCKRLTPEGIIAFCEHGEILRQVTVSDIQMKNLVVAEYPDVLMISDCIHELDIDNELLHW